MSWLRFGRGLLAVSVLALGGVAHADHGCGSPCGPVMGGCGGCGGWVGYGDCGMAAPQYVTVTVCEMVPQQYQANVTRYRWEAQQQTYTAYKSEWVPEQQTRTFTVLVPKTENYTVPVTRCRMVPVQQQVTY